MNVKNYIVCTIIIGIICIIFSSIFGGAYLYHRRTVSKLIESNRQAQRTVSNIKDAIGRLIKIESERYQQTIDEIRRVSIESETNRKKLEETNRELRMLKERERKRIQALIDRAGSVTEGIEDLREFVEGFKKE